MQIRRNPKEMLVRVVIPSKIRHKCWTLSDSCLQQQIKRDDQKDAFQTCLGLGVLELRRLALIR